MICDACRGLGRVPGTSFEQCPTLCRSCLGTGTIPPNHLHRVVYTTTDADPPPPTGPGQPALPEEPEKEFQPFSINDHINPYIMAEYHQHPDGSFIWWRRGTGDNMELMNVQARHKRKGVGTELFREMLRRLILTPPYATVYGFTRKGNLPAQHWYL
jgi:hypothetical protein